MKIYRIAQYENTYKEKDMGTSHTISLPDKSGIIEIVQNSKYAPDNRNSVINFVVEEDKRGKGIGSELVNEFLTQYKGQPLSAQVSSYPSLVAFYNRGFRNPRLGNVSILEYEKERQKSSSVYLQMN